MNLMGVDLGIHKVACFVLGDAPEARIHDVTGTAAPRDYQLMELSRFVHDIALVHQVDQVWIEDTLVGNNVKYSIQLTEVRGAVMAALALSADVRLVNVGTWKKGTVGAGNANKDSIRDYIHVSNPAYAPLCGSDQDLYDAACIALYGRQIMERASDLRLVTG
jgi:Holliday junction resolvasome RuvABC endonuclease subunit